MCTIAGGLVVLYCIGIPWMIMMTEYGVAQAAALMSPFILGDLIKAVIAAMVIVAVKKSWPLLPTDTNA